MAEISKEKSKKILKHRTVRGKQLTRKDEELFRSRAVGLPSRADGVPVKKKK